MSIFGALIDNDMAEQAVLGHLRKWLPTYLAESERQHGRPPGAFERPRVLEVVGRLDKWPDDHIPALFVVCPGLAGEPVKNAREGYSAAWSVGVACVVSAQDRASTRRLAGRYGAAIRACLLQQRSLGGFATGVDWQDQRLIDVPDDAGRTLASVHEVFAVHVDGVVNPFAGPAVPDPKEDPLEPYDDWPRPETTELEVEAIS